MGISKWLHNISGATKNYGTTGDIPNNGFYEIQNTAERDKLGTNTTLFSDIAASSVRLSADGINDYSTDATKNWNFLISKTTLDPTTGGLASSPKWAPDGWLQVYHEIEFETSKLNSIHDKDKDNNDLGFTTAKFFNAAGAELTDQGDIDTDCVLTQIDFMPDHDYAIKSGMIAQISSPPSSIYVWCFAAPGIADVVFCEGGINLEYVGSKTLVGLDGTAASILEYSHPILGAGAGTNKIRFLLRHAAGLKHRVQIIFEYYAE